MRTLIERYRDYLALLEQAGDAIARRDETALRDLEAASADALAGIQRQWQDADRRLSQDADGLPVSWLPSLRESVARALEQMQANQLALAAWLEETGGSIAQARQGQAAVLDYGAERAEAHGWVRCEG
jgi:hypothetical protein